MLAMGFNWIWNSTLEIEYEMREIAKSMYVMNNDARVLRHEAPPGDYEGDEGAVWVKFRSILVHTDQLRVLQEPKTSEHFREAFACRFKKGQCRSDIYKFL